MENKDQIEAIMALAHRYIPREKLIQFGLIIEEEKEMFITEDGVKKYPGDSWFYINNSGEVKKTNNYTSTTPGFVTKRYDDEKLAMKASVELHDTKLFSLNDINEFVKNLEGAKSVKDMVRKLVYTNLHQTKK